MPDRSGPAGIGHDPGWSRLLGGAAAVAALAVVAHPDDESFGLGAVISQLVDLGARVDLLCFTAGEASTLGSSPGLAAVRSRELKAAGDVLGLSRVRLCGFPDGGLAQTEPAALDDEVERVRDGASLLVAFEPRGVSGHPDHVAATAAALRSADRHRLPVLEWGISGEVAEKLNREFGTNFSGFAPGTGALALHVDRARQRQAIRRHRTQSRSNPVLARRLHLQGELEVLRRREPHPLG